MQIVGFFGNLKNLIQDFLHSAIYNVFLYSL